MLYFPRNARRNTSARTQEPRPYPQPMRGQNNQPPFHSPSRRRPRDKNRPYRFGLEARSPPSLRSTCASSRTCSIIRNVARIWRPYIPHFGLISPLVYFRPGLIYGVSFAPVFLLAQNPPACVLAIKVRYQVPPCGHMLCATCADRSENDRVSRK